MSILDLASLIILNETLHNLKSIFLSLEESSNVIQAEYHLSKTLGDQNVSEFRVFEMFEYLHTLLV
jgi:hypothetical protein